MWRALQNSGRPWPVLDEDEVVDYLILEAVAARAAKDEADSYENAKKEQAANAWREKAGKDLEQFR